MGTLPKLNKYHPLFGTFCLILLILILIIYNIELIKLLISYFRVSKNKFTEVSNSTIPLKIAITTAENRKEDYIKYHDINIQKYCDKYSYDYIRTDNCKPEEINTYWCKVLRVKEILLTNKYDYVMWLDSDTIIKDYSVSLEYYIKKYGYKDIYISYENVGGILKYITQFFTMLNAGIFIIKNSEIGLKFINDCLDYLDKRAGDCITNNKLKGMWAGDCYEQGVINMKIKYDYSEYTFIDYNQEFIKNISILLGYHPKIVDSKGIVHLAGYSNKKRNKEFEKYINLI